MSENSEQSVAAASADTKVAFKGYADAYKALRGLQPSISEDARADYLNRLRATPSSRYVAFRLLALRAVGDMQTKLTPFIPQLEEILNADSTHLDLRKCDSLDAVSKAVSHRLSELHTKSDLKQFARARSHLPILYGVIRVWDDPARFQAAVNAFAETIDRLTKPKRFQKSAPSNNLEIVARALTERVPEKPLLGKALSEMLRISQALFRQSAETSRENLELQSKIGTTTTEIETLRISLENETKAKEILQQEVAKLRTDLSQLESELEREKGHFETLKGHGEEDRERAVGDAVARLRSELLRRVENIRLFADRDQPNRQGILGLLTEIGEIFEETE
jgi:hypothetical protein